MRTTTGTTHVIQATLLAGVIVLMLTIPSFGAGEETATAVSPDGRLTISISIGDGVARYSVTRDGKAVVLPSAVGFRFAGSEPMSRGFISLAAVSRGIDETWQPVWGTDEAVNDRCTETVVQLSKAGGRVMVVTLRAYDDGVAFRCELPLAEGFTEYELIAEDTEFRFAGDHTAWWNKADYDSYEHLFNETPLSEIDGANTPVTMRTADGLHVSIHEANLTSYAGMTLKRSQRQQLALECELVPWPDGVKVRGAAPLVTPWRTIQVGETAGALIESHLIENLNEPCAIEDVSWIRPMKYVGIWWGMHIAKETWHEGPRHGATNENVRRYIDFASKNGIGAVLVEGWNTGWDRWGSEGAFDFVTPYPDFDIDALATYASESGVALIGHHETGGDVPTYEKHVDAAFDLYARSGISAVKTGYAGGIFPRGQHHHGQWMVEHYRMVVEKAASYRIMLDVHEPIKPTGIRRTWPNMMTREGVRGMEYNAWSEGNPPEHTTILPFTRMLAGPLDYTPGIFDIMLEEHKPNNRVHTTLAKQLALYVVLYSPMQMAADLIENYEGHPAFRFVRLVPCDWDETRILGGVIGDHVTIARRKGRHWFLGSITDENARTIDVPLDFLGEDGPYSVTVYADAPDADWETNPTAYEITGESMTEGETLTLRLAPGGGAAVTLSPHK
ncbi:glycoside hydrolase family 97 protein [bacterium]|nr:glycoside hydrolase family 97 protein [bacterium]